MTRQAIIEKTIKAIHRLPEDKATEIADFADFLMLRYEEYCLLNGMSHLSSESKSFEFLNNEDEIYTLADLKEIYNGER